jgi:peptidoglycan/LPS O-acetylase OafA/YrhL
LDSIVKQMPAQPPLAPSPSAPVAPRPADAPPTRLARPLTSPRREVEASPQEQRNAYRSDWWEPSLDGLRAVACLLVVLHHAYAPWFAGMALANVGVALFFCLSGFLIFVIASREYQRTGTLSLRRFYRRRILRIWPLYFVVVAASLAVNLAPDRLVDPGAFRHLSTTEYIFGYGYVFFFFLSNLFLAFNFVGDHHWFAPDFLVVTWSIAVEEQFYAVFPFVFVRVMRPGFPKALFVVGAMVAGLVARFAFVNLPIDLGAALVIPSNAGLYYFSLSYIDLFVLGAVAGYAYIHRGRLGAERPRTMAALLVLALLSTVALLFWWDDALWPPYQWYSPLIYTFLAITLSCLIYIVAVSPGSRYAAVLRARPLRILGFLSYGMYLIHVPVLHVIRWHLDAVRPAIELPEVFQVLLFQVYVLASVVAAATVLYVLVERPFLLLKQGSRASASKPSELTSSTVPWTRCLILALATMIVLDLLYWKPL